MTVSIVQSKIDSTPGILYDIGAKAVSPDKLKTETIDHDLSFYWLGEQSNRHMTIDHSNPSVVTLAYTDVAEEKSLTDSPEISVSTHIDEDHYVNAMNGAVHIATDTALSNSQGDVVIINSSLLNEMVIKLSELEA